MEKYCNNRAIDTAGETTNDPTIADLLSHLGNFGFAEGRHGPVARAAADLLGEVPEKLGAPKCVNHLGMKLNCIEAARFINDCGVRCIVADRNGPKPFGDSKDCVTMTHPYLQTFIALLPDAVKERALINNLDVCPAEFAVVSILNPPTKLGDHGLFAVTDAKNRYTRFKDLVGRPRCVLAHNTGRAARQDDARGIEGPHHFFRLVERHDLGIDARLADAPGDKLGDLGAKVDNEDVFGVLPR